MRRLFSWIVVFILIVAFHVLNYLHSPEEMATILRTVTRDFKSLAEAYHALFMIILLAGLSIQRVRDFTFFAFLATISISTAVISLKFRLYAYSCLFMLLFILIIRAYVTGRLRFDLSRIKYPAIICGVCGLIAGYWYPQWIDSPVFRNALLFSPLGIVYSPSLLATGGLICFSSSPKSYILETAVGFALLLSGFWGMLILRVWFDAILILMGLFYFLRFGSRLEYHEVFESAE